MAESKARKLSGKELFWYILSGLLALLGLIFVVFALIGDYLPVLASDNWVFQSEAVWLTSWSPLGYRYWGIILFGVAAVIASIALNFFAREGDRDEERAIRRAQRLAAANEPIDVTPEKE